MIGSASPTYRPHYNAMMAEAQMGWAGLGGRVEHLDAAERAALKALALDPNLANAHNALSGVSADRLQWLEVAVHDRAALTLAPNDGFIRSVVAARPITYRHRFQKAVEEARRAYLLAPANPFVAAFVSKAYALAGQEMESLKYAALATELGFPKESYPLPYVYWLEALHARRYAEAADILVKALDARDPEQTRTAEAVRLTYAALADPSQRSKALAARNRLYPSNSAKLKDFASCLIASNSYALLSANDTAYELANQCLDQGAQGSLFVWTDYWIPELRAFRQDGRFQAYATRLGWMDYWQQYGPPDDCELKNNKLKCH